MSLFDVIKYPLSDPLTYDEYDNLPDVIKDRWLLTLNTENMFNFFSDKDSLSLLKKIIENYEPI
jgi:hypothetical protein